MHKKRLLKLADLVEQSVEKSHGRKGFQFNMEHWGRYNREVVKTPALDCGTSACMLGIAALSGAFKRQGLSYRIQHGVETTVNHLAVLMNGSPWGGIGAAMELFDIDLAEANFLFMPRDNGMSTSVGKRGARYHAKRVRKFVEHGGIF